MKIEKMLINGNSVTGGELNRAKELAGNIRSSHFLLKERFRDKEEEANRLGPRAVQRHNLMSESYLMALEEFLDAIEEFLAGIENLLPEEDLSLPGRETKTLHSDGTHTESTWSCCARESDTEHRGIT